MPFFYFKLFFFTETLNSIFTRSSDSDFNSHFGCLSRFLSRLLALNSSDNNWMISVDRRGEGGGHSLQRIQGWTEPKKVTELIFFTPALYQEDHIIQL